MLFGPLLVKSVYGWLAIALISVAGYFLPTIIVRPFNRLVKLPFNLKTLKKYKWRYFYERTDEEKAEDL